MATANLDGSDDLAPHLPPHQVVTLAFLSEDIPASLIAGRLAQSVMEEAETSVVLVAFQPYNSGAASHNGTPPAYLNGEFHMPGRVSQTAGGFHFLTLGVRRDDPPSPAGIVSLLNQLTRHFRHVLLEVPASEHAAPWLMECMIRSGLTLLFLRTSTENCRAANVILGEAGVRGRDGDVQVKPVACMADDEPSDQFDLLVQSVAAPAHLFVRGCPAIGAGETEARSRSSGLFRADIRRLAREIGGRLVGLALSSGAAKGFAHIGVIQVLEENGIEVDVIAGSSMGAYVGSLWAHGNDGAELERLARELEARWALWTLIDPVLLPRQGLLRGFAVKRRLMRSLGQARFADLVRPMRVIAANLATLERTVFSSGEVATAVHASSAVPGICVPLTIDGETYTDGGIVDPLPVDVLREMGVSRVIAVNVIPTPDRIRKGLDGRAPARHRESSVRKLFRRIFSRDEHLNYFARGNLLEILMRSLYGAQIRVAEASCRQADLVLRPKICDDRWVDYRYPGKFIALGREEAERRLAEIKALVGQKEVKHERNFAAEAVATIP